MPTIHKVQPVYEKGRIVGMACYCGAEKLTTNLRLLETWANVHLNKDRMRNG